MTEINSDFIDSYITNDNDCIVNNDINEYLFSIQHNTLNVLHVNIRSYNRNKYDFWCLINDSIKCLDIILFTETWNNTCCVPQKLIGFSNFKTEKNYNQNDGVIIYINNKHNISVEQLHIFSEASCLKINLKNKEKPLTILATYRSLQTNISTFLDELSKVMFGCINNKNCIWIGDINVDI